MSIYLYWIAARIIGLLSLTFWYHHHHSTTTTFGFGPLPSVCPLKSQIEFWSGSKVGLWAFHFHPSGHFLYFLQKLQYRRNCELKRLRQRPPTNQPLQKEKTIIIIIMKNWKVFVYTRKVIPVVKFYFFISSQSFIEIADFCSAFMFWIGSHYSHHTNVKFVNVRHFI